ncbi:hypothetical protein MNBD_GAMMA12-483 [hydrothermal vent metagenome]|uniref:Uncharacterized protein n=1 Tax=hydrothermal vent metagenome TaxID=652676 RepID=A0A3B0YEM4_9ZZZZ
MSKLLTGQELIKACEKRGIDTRGERVKFEDLNKKHRAEPTDYELQQRLITYKRHIRESRMWMLALISALTSFSSAIIALIAVATK